MEKSGTHRLRWEEGERRNIQQPQSHHNVVRKCGNALLTVCYVPCVPSSEEERKHSSQRSLIWHTLLGQVEKSGTHRLRWEERENSHIQQPQSHHNVVRCGDALLTRCYVPCVPSSEEERKHSSQGSLTWHTSLGQVEKSGTHHLRWE